jgi:hypothetical protein
MVINYEDESSPHLKPMNTGLLNESLESDSDQETEDIDAEYDS